MGAGEATSGAVCSCKCRSRGYPAGGRVHPSPLIPHEKSARSRVGSAAPLGPLPCPCPAPHRRRPCPRALSDALQPSRASRAPQVSPRAAGASSPARPRPTLQAPALHLRRAPATGLPSLPCAPCDCSLFMLTRARHHGSRAPPQGWADDDPCRTCPAMGGAAAGVTGRRWSRVGHSWAEHGTRNTGGGDFHHGTWGSAPQNAVPSHLTKLRDLVFRCSRCALSSVIPGV